MDNVANPTTSIVQPQVDCHSAEEFLNAIVPWSPYFCQYPVDESWLFRGQERDWPVLPSIFRNDVPAVERLSKLTSRDIRSGDRLLIEAELIIDFFNIADSQGLILPGDSQRLRSFLEAIKSKIVRCGNEDTLFSDYYDELLLLAALAQHYGMPTQLLDWTKKVFVAAFFAAKGPASNNESPHERLVVWAFHFPRFGMQPLYDSPPIRIVTAPGSTNPNLQAQQGVFTILSSHYTKTYEKEYKCYPPFDKFLEHNESHSSLSGCILRKFSLPHNEAKNLLHLLAKLGITDSTIYPGYHSIAEDIRMKTSFRSLNK